MTRNEIPKSKVDKLLLKSKRRCCLCVYLKGDRSQKRLQIAHIDHDPNNCDCDNLVPLCLDHHDEYDSITRLSKKLTDTEVITYRNKLFELNKKEGLNGLNTDKNKRQQTVTDISERFNHILKLMNQWYQDFSVGKLAEIMGLEKVSDLSKYFNGQEEPIFAFMEKFCDCFGVNVDWLKFGDATPYCSTEYTELFALDYYERICELQPKFIYFVKSKSKECKTVIVLEIEEYKYIYFPKSYHISSYVGSTGREQIFSFYELIKKLKDSGFYNQCFGRIVEHKLFDDIITGRVFLGSVCNRYGFNEPWWDDFTDVYHEYPIANGYEKSHGKEFIYAQRIVRGFLDKEKY